MKLGDVLREAMLLDGCNEEQIRRVIEKAEFTAPGLKNHDIPDNQVEAYVQSLRQSARLWMFSPGYKEAMLKEVEVLIENNRRAN